MSFGASIFLIAVGAILKFAVTASVAGVKIQTVGLILMVVGILGLLLSFLWLALSSRRAAAPPVANDERPTEVVRERPYR
jgi:hypothetical protein